MRSHRSWFTQGAALVAALIALASLSVRAAPVAGAAASSADLYSNEVIGTSYSATVTVTRNPGNDADVFWSNQFFMENALGTQNGYFGMQTNAEGGRILVSVWGSPGCQAASATIQCKVGVEGTEVAGLSLIYTWVTGHTYRFTFTKVDADHWQAVFTDTSTGQSITLGTITVLPSGSAPVVLNNVVQWVEYFDWDNPNASAAGAAGSSAVYTAPVVGGVQTKFEPPLTGGNNNATLSANRLSASMVSLPGNSSRQPITLAGNHTWAVQGGEAGQAVTLATTPTTATVATPIPYNGVWEFDSGGTIRVPVGTWPCLQANPGGPATVATCPPTPSPLQVWHYRSNGEIFNPASDACLTAPAALAGDFTVSACGGQADQTFSAPAYTPVVTASAAASPQGPGTPVSAGPTAGFADPSLEARVAATTLVYPIENGTSPRVARLSSGRLEVAYASTFGALTTAGPSGSSISTQILRAGSSPSITALPGGGYEIAGIGTDGSLHVWGTDGEVDFHLPVAAGSSPSITTLANGSYEIAYAGPGNYLEVTNAHGIPSWLGYPLAAGTSPSIVGLSGGGFEIAGQSYTGRLLLDGPTGASSGGLAMGAGASPSLAAGSNNCYSVAFRASSGVLAAGGCSTGIRTLPGGVFAPGTDPTLVSTGGLNWQVAMQGSNHQLWMFASSGSAWSDSVTMSPRSSPGMA